MKKKKTGGGSQTRTAARGSAAEKGEKEKKIVAKPDVGQKKEQEMRPQSERPKGESMSNKEKAGGDASLINKNRYEEEKKQSLRP